MAISGFSIWSAFGAAFLFVAVGLKDFSSRNIGTRKDKLRGLFERSRLAGTEKSCFSFLAIAVCAEMANVLAERFYT